ncbi:type IV pilus biogenesis/stability protein PilW [Wielerella bovis]|uniref:type IV pilus biogenesis/stability protein PilW n=1 Tax=Wielerella bovis TaxID=2917790 RepID=UPI003D29BFBA
MMINKRLLTKWMIACCVGAWLSGCVTVDNSGRNITRFKDRSRSEIEQESMRIKTQLAVEYMNARDYRAATRTIESVIQQNPSYEMAWLIRAQIYQHLKTFDKAEESFKKALALSPNNAEINNNYGWFLCGVMNKPTAGIAYFDKALADPTYPTPEISYLNKGICTAKSGQNNMADAYFERALQNNPDFIPVYKERARAFLGAGKNIEADQQFRQYQSRVNALNPDDLLLGWKIANANGETHAAYEYELQLKTNFPYSDELKLLSTGNAE